MIGRLLALVLVLRLSNETALTQNWGNSILFSPFTHTTLASPPLLCAPKCHPFVLILGREGWEKRVATRMSWECPVCQWIVDICSQIYANVGQILTWRVQVPCHLKMSPITHHNWDEPVIRTNPNLPYLYCLTRRYTSDPPLPFTQKRTCELLTCNPCVTGSKRLKRNANLVSLLRLVTENRLLDDRYRGGCMWLVTQSLFLLFLINCQFRNN